MAKRLIGSGCPFGCEFGRSRDPCIDGVVIVKGEGAVLGANLGHPIVTNGDGDALFPNYFAGGLV